MLLEMDDIEILSLINPEDPKYSKKALSLKIEEAVHVLDQYKADDELAA